MGFGRKISRAMKNMQRGGARRKNGNPGRGRSRSSRGIGGLFKNFAKRARNMAKPVSAPSPMVTKTAPYTPPAATPTFGDPSQRIYAGSMGEAMAQQAAQQAGQPDMTTQIERPPTREAVLYADPRGRDLSPQLGTGGTMQQPDPAMMQRIQQMMAQRQRAPQQMQPFSGTYNGMPMAESQGPGGLVDGNPMPIDGPQRNLPGMAFGDQGPQQRPPQQFGGIGGLMMNRFRGGFNPMDKHGGGRFSPQFGMPQQPPQQFGGFGGGMPQRPPQQFGGMGGMMNRFRGGFGGGMPQRPPQQFGGFGGGMPQRPPQQFGGFGGGMPQRPPQQFGGFGSRFGGFGGGMPQRPPRQLMERMGGMPRMSR